MKRSASWILIIMLAASTLCSACKILPTIAQGTTLEVVNALDGTHQFNFTDDTPIGTTFVANITLTNCNDLAGYQLNITYDPTLLNVTSPSDITVPSDNVFSLYAEIVTVQIQSSSLFIVVIMGFGGPRSVNVTSGRLCQVNFTIINNATAACANVGFGRYTILSDATGYEIPFTPVVGSYCMSVGAGPIYIRADGSIDPITANITSADKITYTFTDNINDSIVVERDGIVIDGVGYALEGTGTEIGIDLSNRMDVRVQNTQIRYFQSGVTVYGSYSSGIRINGNTIENNAQGITLNDTFNNNISGNTIANNDNGIVLASSSNNSICGNNVTSNNYYGIGLDNSYFNNISRNNITYNYYGIGAFTSSFNRFYHNNFIVNVQQVGNEQVSSGNAWDDGYPSGGNYWSDYTGTDADGDGIGDVPYPIFYGNNQDNYPLISPWTPPDLTLMTIETSKTVIGQGHSLGVKVVSANQGSKVEALSIRVYANSTLIGSLDTTLVNELSNVFLFSWDTSGYARAYVISANVTPLEGEIHLDDNVLTFGVIKVSCVGDVNGDYFANIQDLVITKNAIPSTPGSAKWNSNADVNDDGFVNIQDYVTVKNHVPSAFP